MTIHSTARVHPTAVIEGDVEIGEGTSVGAHCYLLGPIRIGARTRVFPHVTIGCEGEHRRRGPAGTIVVGDDTLLREHVVIQRGTGDRDTTVGSHVYAMSHTYVAHDCWVEDHVTLSPRVSLAGHTRVMRAANVGMGALAHQFSTIGAYAMVGMGAVVTRDVPPFALVTGNPARFRRFNIHAFAGLGLGASDLGLSEGVVVSTHPAAKPLLEEFYSAARRSVLRCIP